MAQDSMNIQIQVRQLDCIDAQLISYLLSCNNNHIILIELPRELLWPLCGPPIPFTSISYAVIETIISSVCV